MTIESESVKIDFEKTSLEFIEKGIHSTFKKKNNKTLRETLKHPRYKI